MAGGYTKVERLADTVKEGLAQGEIYQEMEGSCGLGRGSKEILQSGQMSVWWHEDIAYVPKHIQEKNM